MRGKSLGFVVFGKETGLLAIADPNAQRLTFSQIGPVTAGGEGAVAVNFFGLVLPGYQTGEGMWFGNESRSTGEFIEIQVARAPQDDQEVNGVYAVSCTTTTKGSLAIGGSSYPVTQAGPVWLGEAVLIGAAGRLSIDLAMRNEYRGRVRFHGTGNLDRGRFDIRDGNLRLAGSVTPGLLVAEWSDERPGLRFEGTLRATRR
jgi:hypothetical protein